MKGWRKFSASLICAIGLGAAIASPASAATTQYPGGGSSFNAGAEGWQVTEAACNVPVLCTATGTYDAGNGNSAGSLAANANVALNLIGLFDSSVTWVSPDFKVGESGATTVHVDRSFSQGSLVDLAPTLDYSVSLVDRSAGSQSTPVKESVAGTAPFIGVDDASSVVAGHTYALAITSDISSSVAGLGLLSGVTTARFDNVSLSVQSSGNGGGGGNGDNGNNGKNGRNTLRSSELLSLFSAGQPGSATLVKGKRLLVRVNCPKSIGRACRVTAQGLLRKGKPATTKRTVKVGSGKGRTIVLNVKPKLRDKVAKRKRLLVSQKVRAGSTTATSFKARKLIRR